MPTCMPLTIGALRSCRLPAFLPSRQCQFVTMLHLLRCMPTIHAFSNPGLPSPVAGLFCCRV
jgi:hypothetical protein